MQIALENDCAGCERPLSEGSPRWGTGTTSLKNDFWQHTGHTESPASRGMCSKGSPTSTEAKTSAAIISHLRLDPLLGPSEWINVHNHEVPCFVSHFRASVPPSGYFDVKSRVSGFRAIITFASLSPRAYALHPGDLMKGWSCARAAKSNSNWRCRGNAFCNSGLGDPQELAVSDTNFRSFCHQCCQVITAYQDQDISRDTRAFCRSTDTPWIWWTSEVCTPAWSK